MPSTLKQYALAAAGCAAVYKVSQVWRAYRRLGRLPGRQLLLFDPIDPITILLARWIPYFGCVGDWWTQFSPYAKLRSTLITTVALSNGRLGYWTSDAEAIAQVMSDRTFNFLKDLEAYKVVSIYGGRNVVASETELWKRHRSIVRGAFGETNNVLAWKEALRILDEVFDDFDARLPVASDSGARVDVGNLTTTVTFLIITSAGFGQSITWIDAEDERQCPPGYKLPFRRALLDALGGIFVYAVTPAWVNKLPTCIVPSSMSKVALAFEELRKHLLAMVDDARSADAKEGLGADLFRRLIEANKETEGETLSDDELISNMFIFLLAGHETSAHTLAFALVLLALYPDVQEELRAEAMQVWPTGKPTSDASTSYSDDYPRLRFSKAVFRETLRHYPAVPRLWKIVQKDAVLPYRTLDSRARGEFVAPSDSVVILDIRAIHMNTLYWGADAEAFRPARFLDTEEHKWPREAFYPFAAGPRACLGMHFAMAESVCILSRIVAHYELLPPPELEGKTMQEKMAHLLAYDVATTITPLNANIVFRKR